VNFAVYAHRGIPPAGGCDGGIGNLRYPGFLPGSPVSPNFLVPCRLKSGLVSSKVGSLGKVRHTPSSGTILAYKLLPRCQVVANEQTQPHVLGEKVDGDQHLGLALSSNR
jgi:hypothetical protein